MTEYKSLNSILRDGLKPKVGDRSKSVDFYNERLYFAVGETALVSIYYMMKFKYISKYQDKYNSFEEYIGVGPILTFNVDSIEDDMELYDASIDYDIPSDQISLLYLIDKDGNTIADKEMIVYYFMSIVSLEEIRNLVFDYLKDDELKESRIWNLIVNEYKTNKEKVEHTYQNYKLMKIKFNEIKNNNLGNLFESAEVNLIK